MQDSDSGVKSGKKGILLFSGGLDSVTAAHLLKEQGVEVLLLHYRLPFDAGIKPLPEGITDSAESLGLKLIVREEGEDFLDMIKNPSHGYGSAVNPCIDCRIFRLNKAFEIMEQEGADFIATGEVAGQRPMSQNTGALASIKKELSFEDLLVRPLSAKLLEPSLPEREGWVDRSKLLDISGRTRVRQMEYAGQHNLKYGSPGGGCVLTEKDFALRFLDLMDHDPDFGLIDFKLLAYGRHLRISPGLKLIAGRHEDDNNCILKAAPEYQRLCMADVEGPVGLLSGDVNDADEDALKTAASVLARYSKLREFESAGVLFKERNGTERYNVKPADPDFCFSLMPHRIPHS